MDLAHLGFRVDSRTVKGADKDLDRMASTTKRAEGAAVGMSTRISAGFKRMAASAALAVGAVMGISRAVSVLSDFEGSMSKVAAVSRATATELAAMRDIAKDLGSTTEFTAGQAADGLTFLAMAGFSAAESIAAIPAVLDLATAAGMGLADAADTASNIMSGFGIAAEDSADVADVLAAAASRANTNVGQLGEAMKFVGPVAAALGISMNDSAAAIGVLSDAGIQGGMAGTSLRMILSQLIAPTGEAAAAIKAMGLTLEEVNPQTNDMTDIMDRFARAGLNAGDAMTIAGQRGGPALLALTSQSANLRKLTGELSDVEGEAKRMADTMRDNLAGDLKAVASAAEGLIIAIGDAGLTAVLRSVFQVLAGGLRMMIQVIDGLAALGSAVGSVVGPLLGFGDSQRQAAQATESVTEAMSEEINQISGLSKLIGEETTMTLGAAQAKLRQAQAIQTKIAAAVEEQRQIVLASEEYRRYEMAAIRAEQNIAAELQRARRAVGDMAPLHADNIRALEFQRQALIDARLAQENLLGAAAPLTPEYQRVEAAIAEIERAIADAKDGMVQFSGVDITPPIDAAVEAAERLKVELAAALGLANAIARQSAMEYSGRGGDPRKFMNGPTYQNEMGYESPDEIIAAAQEKASGGGRTGSGGQTEAQKAHNAALSEAARLFTATRTSAEAYAIELAGLNLLLEGGYISTETYGRALEQLGERFAETSEFADWANGLMQGLSDSMLDAIVSGQDLGEVFSQLALQIAKAALQAMLFGTGPMGGMFGSTKGVGLIPGFAKGTNSAPGGMAIVGEEGPELVNLQRGAQVIPADKTARMLAGGAPAAPAQPKQDVKLRNIIVFDRNEIGKYMSSPEGERVLVKVMGENNG